MEWIVVGTSYRYGFHSGFVAVRLASLRFCGAASCGGSIGNGLTPGAGYSGAEPPGVPGTITNPSGFDAGGASDEVGAAIGAVLSGEVNHERQPEGLAVCGVGGDVGKLRFGTLMPGRAGASTEGSSRFPVSAADGGVESPRIRAARRCCRRCANVSRWLSLFMSGTPPMSGTVMLIAGELLAGD